MERKKKKPVWRKNLWSEDVPSVDVYTAPM